MDAYVWVKALHVAAAVTWIGGMLVAGVTLAGVALGERAGAPVAPSLVDSVCRWDRRVTSPAMLLTWAFGIAVAMHGGWFAAPWLMIKLVLVAVLSAVHGLLSGTLRRLRRDTDRPGGAAVRYAAPATIVCVFVIALLAVAKPI